MAVYLVVRADNVGFNQAAAYVEQSGTGIGLSVAVDDVVAGGTGGTGISIANDAGGGSTAAHGLSVNLTGTGNSLASAANFVSSNAAASAVQISGSETGRGSLKITHTGTGSDTNASALSLDLQGVGTDAQGIFLDSTTGGTTGKLLNLRNNGTEYLTLNATGQLGLNTGGTNTARLDVRGDALFKNTSDTTTAFVIQNSSAVPQFTADSLNSRVYIGNPTADATGALLVVDTKNTAGDPSGIAGGIYYNSNAGKFRCYEGSGWKDCDTAGGGGGVTSVNSQSGAISIANATGSAGTITIDDAAYAAKGIASFNSTNFSVSLGAVNTIQNINSGATPTFAGVNTNAITPSGALTVGDAGQIFTLQGSAASTITATGGGFTTTVGFTGSPTAAVTYNFDRTATAGTYTICSSAGNCSGAGGGYVQLAPGSVQADGTTNNSIFINKTNATGNILELQKSAADVFTVGNTGNITATGTANFQNASNSAAAFKIQNATTNALFTADTSSMRISIGSAGTPVGQLYVGGLVPSSNLNGAGTSVSSTWGLQVVGNYAYALENANAIKVIDVSNPASPSIISTNSITGASNIAGMYVQGKYIYLADSSSNKLYIYDISNPNALTSVGSVTIVTGARGMVVSGRYAYIGNNTSGLQVVDVTNPAAPVSVYSAATYVGSSLYSLFVQGNYLYVTNNSGFLFSMSLANPALPVGVGTSTNTSNHNIYAQGRYLYTENDNTNLLQVYDISNPASIANPIGTVATGSSYATATYGYPYELIAQGRYVYTINGNGQLYTVDVSTPTSPAVVGNVAASGTPRFTALSVSGRTAYVVDYANSKMWTYDIGGTYVQQLEAGGINTGTLTASNDANIGGNLSVNSSLTVAGTTQLSGNVGASGQVLLQNTTNSTTAFQIQNASAGSLFSVDSTNSVISLNSNNSGALQAWGNAGNSSYAGREGAASVAANGYFYSFGGINTTGFTNGSTTAQGAKINNDGTLGTWGTTTALPGNRTYASAAYSNGYVYVVGGQTTNSVTNAQNTVLYAKLATDGTIAQWNTAANTIGTNLTGGTTSISNGYIYYAGGQTTAGAPVSTVYYAKLNADGSPGAFTTTTQSLVTARNGSASFVANGYLYVIGGVGAASTYSTKVQYAPIAANGNITTAFTEQTVFGTAREGGAAGYANGYLYWVGGFTAVSTTSQILSYAPLNANGSIGSVTDVAGSLTQTRGDASYAMVNGYMYVIGGSNGSATQTTAYYASTARIKVSGTLDLTAGNAGNLNSAGAGSSLIAGNTSIDGTLNIQGQANFNSSVSIANELTASGYALFQNATNSSTAFQIQNATGAAILTADTTNQRISIGSVGTAAGQLYVGGQVPSTTVSSTALGGSDDMRIQGRYAYIVYGSSNLLYTYDITNAASPILISTTNTSSTGGCVWPHSLALAGHYAYVHCETNDKIAIYDISNPKTLVNTSTTATGATDEFGLYVQGRYLYAVTGTGGVFQTWDVVNPNLPVKTGTYSFPANTRPFSVFVQGKYAYVSTLLSGTPASSLFYVLDVSDPTTPTLKGTVSLGSTPIAGSESNTQYVWVQGNYAYASVAGANQVKVINISDPTSPSVTSTISTVHNSPSAVQVQGKILYVANYTTTTVDYYDISNPASPVAISGFSTGTGAISMVIQGRYLYATLTSTSNLVVYDVGGAYVQQLEAGGIEAGTLQVDGNTAINGDTTIQGGTHVGQSLLVDGNLGASAQVLLQNATNSTTAFQIQNANGSTLLGVDTATATGSIVNPSFENPNLSNWAVNTGSGSFAQSSAANLFSKNSLAVTTSTTANSGVKYDTASLLLPSTTYALSFYAKIASGSFTVQAGRSDTDAFGGEAGNNCLTLGTVTTSWTRFTCNFTTGGSVTTGGYIFIRQNDSTTRTFFIDGVQLEQSSSAPAPFQEGLLTTGGGVFSSPVVIQSANNVDGAFAVYGSGNTTPILNVDTVNRSVTIGSTSVSTAARLFVTGNNTANTVLVLDQNAATADIISARRSGTAVFTVNNNGNALFQNTTDSVNSFQIQNAAATQLFNIDATNAGSANLLTNGGFETNVTGWALKGAASSLTQDTTIGYLGTDSLKFTSTSGATDGVKYTYGTGLLTSGQSYTLSFYAKSSVALSTLVAGRADNGVAESNCTLSPTPSALLPTTTNWTRFSCTFSATAQSGTPYIYVGTNGTAANLNIDGVQLEHNTIATVYRESVVSLNGSINSPVNFQNSSDSSTAFGIQNASGQGILQADSTFSTTINATTYYGKILIGGIASNSNAQLQVGGSIQTNAGNIIIAGVSGSLSFSSANLISGGTVHGVYNTGAPSVAIGDVLVQAGLSGSNVAVTQSSNTRDPNVYGVAAAAATTGNYLTAFVSGNENVNVDGTVGTINLGDQLVAGPSGKAIKDNNATTGIVGYSLSSSAISTVTQIPVAINIVHGQNTPVVRPSGVTDSTSAFQIQNAAGTSTVLNADTTNQRISVGSVGTATGQLYVAGKVPVAAGSLGTTGGPVDVQVVGRYAYVANFTNNSLQVFDVSGTTPVLTGSVSTGASSGPTTLFVSGHYAYTTNFTSSKLAIFDISNPTTPTALGTVTVATNPSSVYVQGRYAYVTGTVSSNNLSVVDINNPNAPVVTNAGFTTGGGNPEELYVQGHYAYSIGTGSTLEVTDISNPATLTNAGSLALGGRPDCSTGGAIAARGITIVGRYLYTTFCDNGTTTNSFDIIDLKNPTSPSITYTGSSNLTNLNKPVGITVQGRYVYIVNYNAGGAGNIAVYDVNTPAAPASVGSVATNNGADSFFAQGRYLYVTAFNAATLQVFDLGGEYAQQLEAGGIESGTLNANGNANFAADVSVLGGLTVGQSLQVTGSLGANGQVAFQNAANSITAFQIQNAAGTVELVADTTANKITVGSATSDTNQILFQVDQFSTYADTATCNAANAGAMYYNTNGASSNMRFCNNANGGTYQWEDLASTAGLNAILFGVVPDSGANPGDISAVTGAQNGPCKVSVGGTTSTVSWTGCTAYSAGRKIVVTAGTAATSSGTSAANVWQHLCLTSATGQPVLSAVNAENANLATASMPSATAPILCLADIKVTNGSAVMTGVYDTRTYTTSIKETVSVGTTAPTLGMLVSGSTTKGVYIPNTTSNGGVLEGVIVATTGSTSTNTINAIIAVSGPGAVKAITGTNTINDFIQGSATAGYAISATSATTTNVYSVLGVARTTWTGGTACSINADACAGSIVLDIKPR